MDKRILMYLIISFIVCYVSAADWYGVEGRYRSNGLPDPMNSKIVDTKSVKVRSVKPVQKNVMYIAWDSRLGFAVNDSYYKKWGLKKIHPLGKGEGVGPFEFVKTFKALPRRHIHLYRFHSERIQ